MPFNNIFLAYCAVNLVLAVFILAKTRRNILSRFYLLCVFLLVLLGLIQGILGYEIPPILRGMLEQLSALLYSVFPFVFLHFMLVFTRRHDILKSRRILGAIYLSGLFGYALVAAGFIPLPFSSDGSPMGHVYYLIWMSILFVIGVALLYSTISGFSERGGKSSLLFAGFVVLMLLLPSPLTFSVFSVAVSDGFLWYFISSIVALAVMVYFVFLYGVMANTPYQAITSALTAMNDILIKTNDNFRIELVKGAVFPLLGYGEKELLGRALMDIIKQNDYTEPSGERGLQEKIKKGFFDAEVIHKDGTSVPMDISLTPVFANEALDGFVGVARDAGARRRAELALQESEERYRILFEDNPSAMWVYDLHSLSFLVANDAAVELYGYSREEFLTMTVPDILSVQTIPDISGQGSEFHKAYGWQHQRKDGKLIDVEMSSHEFVFKGRYARLVCVNDISGRMDAEQPYTPSGKKNRIVSDDELLGNYTSTPRGQILSCNASFARIFGFGSVEEALEWNVVSLYPSLQARIHLLNRLQKKKKISSYEEELRRVDGKPVYVVEDVVGCFNQREELVEIKARILGVHEKKEPHEVSLP